MVHHRCCFISSKPATREPEPIEDLLQHFIFDASSESLTLIGVDITRENLHQGLPGVRVCVGSLSLSLCLSFGIKTQMFRHAAVGFSFETIVTIVFE